MDDGGLRLAVHNKVFQMLAELSGQNAGGTSAYGVSTDLSALGLDSLKLVELVFELEVDYEISADESALSRLRTIGDLIDMICEAVAKSGAGHARQAGS
jgi:acyl carrier protein